jgi:hypothetical protein
MQYLLSMYYPEMAEGAISADDMEAAQVAMGNYAMELHEAGVLVAATVLQPSAESITVTADSVNNGPFLEQPEPVGGVIILEVPDSNAAINWAQRCPAAAWGSIEIRPTAVYVSKGSWTS